MTITITERNVYGQRTFYPACNMARGFAAIAGTKTLTELTLRRIREMGFTILFAAPPREWTTQ